jgi:hypothetical protein
MKRFHLGKNGKKQPSTTSFSQYEPASPEAEKIWRSKTQDLIDLRSTTITKYLADLDRLQRRLNDSQTYREVVETQDKLLELDLFYFRHFLENHPVYKDRK